MLFTLVLRYLFQENMDYVCAYKIIPLICISKMVKHGTYHNQLSTSNYLHLDCHISEFRPQTQKVEPKNGSTAQ